ncbi:MAG: glucokinase [Methyloligellaceae bacterium]
MTSTGLIADIGGTNIRLALATSECFHNLRIYKCTNFSSLLDAVRFYLKDIKFEGEILCGLLAVAGPVTGDKFELTNYSWKFSINELSRELGIDSLEVVNDFVAVSLGVPVIEAANLLQIGPGKRKVGEPAVVIGPGTGLGAGSLIQYDGVDIAIPGEGGHITMPAKTQRQFNIFQVLLKDKYHHISAERVCSGKGLENLYQAIIALDQVGGPSERTAEEISRLAISGECKVCEECLDLMCGFLGVVAGDLAVMLCATGGVYIAGGIPAKLGDYFIKSRFREEFEDKGRFSSYLKGISTCLIADSHVALHGLHHELVQGHKLG